MLTIYSLISLRKIMSFSEVLFSMNSLCFLCVFPFFIFYIFHVRGSPQVLIIGPSIKLVINTSNEKTERFDLIVGGGSWKCL